MIVVVRLSLCLTAFYSDTVLLISNEKFASYFINFINLFGKNNTIITQINKIVIIVVIVIVVEIKLQC